MSNGCSCAPGRHVLLELAHGVVVAVQLFIHLSNTTLNHLVGRLLVLQHHLHQVKFTLHESTRAESGVDICDISGTNASLANSLQGCLHVEELARELLTGATPLRRTLAVQVTFTLLRMRNALQGTECLVGALFQLLVENATFLVNFDHGYALVVGNDSSGAVSDLGLLLHERFVSRVLDRQGLLVPNGHIRVN